MLLFPEDPNECFEFGALAFDLADRLQTPVFVLLDLDIGMNEWLCEPLSWDAAHRLDRGKVLTAGDLEAGREFGRYLDVDGDGIPYRTLPGTHPTRGAFFTRGTSRDRYARYTEEGGAYVDNMQRLLRKFETAKALVPKPVRTGAATPSRCGVIYFGSTAPALRRGARRARGGRRRARHAARARLPVLRGGRRLHPRARPGVRGRAEPRRASCARSSSTRPRSIRPG